MAKHQFLTEEWMEAVKALREEVKDDLKAPTHSIRMNQVITDVPWGDDSVDAHLDTSGDEAVLDLGHLEDPDLTVTTDYETAKAIFVAQDPQAGMQAFMAGKIKVQGDMTKMMAMQQQAPDAAADALAEKVKEITE